MKKGEIYIFEQPKHIISSIIIVKNNFPINEELHKKLEDLSKISDLYFIFSDYHFIKSRKIDKEKFTKLYRAGGMIDTVENNLGDSLFKLLDYDITIFQKHLSFIILDTESNLNNKTIENLTKLTGSTIVRPVFKIRRLTSQEFFQIYKNDEEEKEKISNTWINKLFNKPKLENNSNLFGAYCSYTSESDVIFFKLSTIKVLISEYLEAPEFIKDIFIKSFNEESDIRYLISSIIKYLGINNLNINLEDVEINQV